MKPARSAIDGLETLICHHWVLMKNQKDLNQVQTRYRRRVLVIGILSLIAIVVAFAIEDYQDLQRFIGYEKAIECLEAEEDMRKCVGNPYR
jgi:hypothetical protein